MGVHLRESGKVHQSCCLGVSKAFCITYWCHNNVIFLSSYLQPNTTRGDNSEQERGLESWKELLDTGEAYRTG